jgi:uncharacterized DUF497 family protein
LVQWDSEKAAANLRKHGVDFADAATVLSDEWALTLNDDDPGRREVRDHRRGRPGALSRGGVHLARQRCPIDFGTKGHRQ